MIATLRPLTYDDLRDMPDDGQRYEIIDGELIVNPAPTWNHQRVLLKLTRLIDDFAREHGAGKLVFAPFDVVLGDHDIVEPDLVFISTDQGRVPGDEHKFEGAPALVVEVISPSSRRTDLAKKLALYRRAGVREYWIADPERQTLVINTLQSEEYIPSEPDAEGRLSSRVLAGLRVDPAMIFIEVD